ncbi:uncharacterized protein LOC135950727 [Calliphora vicina]|uniref:uncharacterized protein LOC135950727 n=1 Tax=Calliphora vicina TaxID=7373 RepID=UPI00325AFE15
MVELRGVRKNSHILLEMVAELDLQGYKYTVPELKTKLHNITARYRKEKQKIGTTGDSPSDWDLYKEVECLLAPSKAYNSEGLVVDIWKKNIEQIEEKINKTSKRVIEIEEEKKNILKNYVDRVADVQKALVEFLKRQCSYIRLFERNVPSSVQSDDDDDVSEIQNF